MDLFVTADATALSTADCLLQYFDRLGAPCHLRSNDGLYSIAEVIKEFLALVGIKQCLSFAFSTERNQ